MRCKLNFFIALIICTVACKKNSGSIDCFPGAATTRTVENKEAMIRLLNDEYYIIEKNTIDTRLYPCSLPPDFKVDNLNVTISGQVKGTLQNGGPCCTENFVISKIEK